MEQVTPYIKVNHKQEEHLLRVFTESTLPFSLFCKLLKVANLLYKADGTAAEIVLAKVNLLNVYFERDSEFFLSLPLSVLDSLYNHVVNLIDKVTRVHERINLEAAEFTYKNEVWVLPLHYLSGSFLDNENVTVEQYIEATDMSSAISTITDEEADNMSEIFPYLLAVLARKKGCNEKIIYNMDFYDERRAYFSDIPAKVMCQAGFFFFILNGKSGVENPTISRITTPLIQGIYTMTLTISNLLKSEQKSEQKSDNAAKPNSKK